MSHADDVLYQPAAHAGDVMWRDTREEAAQRVVFEVSEEYMQMRKESELFRQQRKCGATSRGVGRVAARGWMAMDGGGERGRRGGEDRT